jgi:hypothetical protein
VVSSSPDFDASTARALEALEAVSTRDLIRAARGLEGRHDRAGLYRFGGVFRSFAYGRQLGGDQWLARSQLRAAVILASPSLAEQLAEAPEPFWRHVREAVRAAGS